MGKSEKTKKPKTPKTPDSAKKVSKKSEKKANKNANGKVGFFSSIKVKLIAGFMLPVVGIVAVGVISYNKASESVIDSYVASSLQTAESIDIYLELVTDTVQSTYKKYMDNDDLKQYFAGVLDIMYPGTTKKADIHKQYLTEMYDNEKGDALVDAIMFLSDEHPSISTKKITTDKPFTEFSKTPIGKDALANSYVFNWYGNVCEADSALGTSSNEYALRLVRKFGTAQTVIIVDVDMAVVKESLDSLDVGEGGYVALVTADGAEIYSSAGGAEGQVFLDKDFYKEAAAGEAASGTKEVTFNGQNYRFIYSKIDGKNIMVCSLIAEDRLIEKVADIKTITVIIVIIAAIIAMAVGVVLATGIGKTISGIVKNLNTVAKGDFTVRINSKRKDEFRLMTDALDDTVDQVKDLIANVQEVNTELVQASDKVYNSSKTFMESSDNIRLSVNEIKTGANRLDEDSDNCLAQMDGLSDKITTVTANTNEIERIVVTTNESIALGISSIEGVTESTKSTTRITGEVIAAIKELEDKTRSIVDFAQIINEIAEETTLLSLNASIEAARAGEAGRGFAVVASQINKLADQSMGSAEQIASIVNEILAKTDGVVKITEEAFEIVQKQNESVEGTTEAFGEMKVNIGTLLESLEEITKNVTNIEGARDITLEAVENISSVSAETSACSVSVADIVDSQSHAIEELNGAASALADKAALLTDLLQKFTV